MTRTKRTYRPTPAQQAAEVQRLISEGKTTKEAAAQVGVTDRTVRRWRESGLMDSENPYIATSTASTPAAPQPMRLIPRPDPGQIRPFSDRHRADVRQLYDDLSTALLALTARPDLAELNPADLLKWVQTLDQVAARALALEAERPTDDAPDAFNARVELQRRRERLAAQYDAASGADDPDLSLN